MLTSSTRLLRLLALLQTRNHWMGPELAERLEVHPRTLRRDIDRLRQLGYPVHASSGVAGGYAFRAGQSLPPLLLDDEEALAVAIALQIAAAGTVSGVEESSLRALVKLSLTRAGHQVLRCHDRGRVTYVELTGNCTEGEGERVTVFPTEGVEIPR